MTIPLTSWLLVPALIWVVFSDLLYRRIPNWLVAALLLIWIGLALSGQFSPTGNPDWRELGESVLGAWVVMVIGFVLFQIGRVGAGDVKLMGVICLWTGASEQWVFVLMTSLIGGVLVLTLPLLKRLERSLAQSWLWLAPRLALQPTMPTVLTAARPTGLPYGLAIAAGAFYTLFIHILY